MEVQRMYKILAIILAVFLLAGIGSAFITRDAFTGQMVENGVFYVNGTEMHVVKDVAMLVECTVGMGSLNKSFNITEEALEHLGFPKPKPLYTSDAL
jgi:uncharacterized membrane protein YkgB